MIIAGGGYIAVEFAGIFAATGVAVTETIRAPQILRGFDHEVRDHLAAEMGKRGIVIRSQTKLASIAQSGDGFVVTTEAGDEIATDLVMYATGRMPNTAGLGLETIGVHLNKRGAVAVDEGQRTTVANVYAIGDVTDRLNLTP